MAIFSDLIENIMEVFIDYFSVHGKSFEECLENLDKVLKKCQETHVVPSWVKFHFIVREAIVLGQKSAKKRDRSVSGKNQGDRAVATPNERQGSSEFSRARRLLSEVHQRLLPYSQAFDMSSC
jgi:hypothetical protein